MRNAQVLWRLIIYLPGSSRSWSLCNKRVVMVVLDLEVRLNPKLCGGANVRSEWAGGSRALISAGSSGRRFVRICVSLRLRNVYFDVARYVK